MSVDIDFANMRAEGGDRRDGFEEFSAQLFHQLGVPANARYERFRGAGGDGGVEAVWHLPSGKIIGLQSKFFLPLKDAHLKQLEKSLDTAIANFPALEKYVVTLPFDPTPTVAARPGKVGQNEKLEDWRKSLEARAAARGTTLAVEWWFASDLKSRLLGMGNPQGRILYWFGTTVLGAGKLDALVAIAEDIAGKRYSPRLTVDTGAGAVLGAFGLDDAWFEAQKDRVVRARSSQENWKQRAPAGYPAEAGLILDALDKAVAAFANLEQRNFKETDRQLLANIATITLPAARRLESALKSDFDKTHGPQSDNVRWRQYQAAYQVSFPAADLDLARDAVKLMQDILAFAESDAARAATAAVVLMRGAAGIGKTHTTIDAAKARIASGRGAIAILGQELSLADDPFRLIAAKLGMSLTAARSEVLGVLAAYAEQTDAPVVLMIDAVNETPERRRWQSWLPSLKAELTGEPVRLLITCRDIYLDESLGAALTQVPTFTHDGFAGREYEAAYAFASFYNVGPPAEVVAQPEFANPLFLHLVCRAALSRKWSTIPGGQVSLTVLIDAILDGANEEAAALLDYDARFENPVKLGAAALAQEMGRHNVRVLGLGAANAILKTVRASAGASGSLLRALETADLVSINSENGMHSLRFAFERLGDLLIAQASLSKDDRQTVANRFTSGDLAGLVTSETTITANAGLLQAYSIVLPEQFQIELVEVAKASPHLDRLTALALDVLAWRDPATLATPQWVLGPKRYIDLIVAFEKVLAVAAVPAHPLNVDWLGTELAQYAILVRDAIWSDTLTRSWYGGGPVRRLIHIAQEQNLEHLSLDSARLLGRTLALFTASPDLNIRDEATQALANLLIYQPIATDLAGEFLSGDDDYIRERVLAVLYGTGLRKREANFWRDIAEPVYQQIFGSGGFPTENVLLRDLGRLVIDEAQDTGVLPNSVIVARTRPPYSSAWPLVFSFPDWDTLKDANPKLPRNFMLGAEFGPDFAVYTVKHATRTFDVASAGLGLRRLNQWIVEQVLDLGYGTLSMFALGYDARLINEVGEERGAAGGRERISKKHQRIYLARLLGRLHDNVPHLVPSWGTAPDPLGLQGVELRSIDPTDLFQPVLR